MYTAKIVNIVADVFHRFAPNCFVPILLNKIFENIPRENYLCEETYIETILPVRTVLPVTAEDTRYKTAKMPLSDFIWNFGKLPLISSGAVMNITGPKKKRTS